MSTLLYEGGKIIAMLHFFCFVFITQIDRQQQKTKTFYLKLKMNLLIDFTTVKKNTSQFHRAFQL